MSVLKKFLEATLLYAIGIIIAVLVGAGVTELTGYPILGHISAFGVGALTMLTMTVMWK